jgi:putative transcriptional regulator
MAKEIVVTLDVMLARRKVRSKALAEFVGITEANLSLLKSGKVKGVRFETLARICEYLDCEPGDILKVAPVAASDRPSGPQAAPVTSQQADVNLAAPSIRNGA